VDVGAGADPGPAEAYVRTVLVNRHRSLLRRALLEARHARRTRAEAAYLPAGGEDGVVLWAAVRDLCRARADIVEDRTRARHRLGKFLLRHGRPWRGGNAWTLTHQRWLGSQRFDEPALAATYAHYRAVLDVRDAQLAAIAADLAVWYDRAPFTDAVGRLSAYRGVTRLGALTLASEVCDWRRFPRAAAFAGFCGLVPSEYSSGPSTRRGHITKTGNAHLRAQLVWVGLGRPAPPRRWARAPRPPARTRPCGCRPGLGRPAQVVWPFPSAPPPARTPRTWSSPRSHGNSPGSSGRR
jgi:transposase